MLDFFGRKKNLLRLWSTFRNRFLGNIQFIGYVICHWGITFPLGAKSGWTTLKRLDTFATKLKKKKKKRNRNLKTKLQLQNNCIILLTVMEKGYLKLHVSYGPFFRLRKSLRLKCSTLIQRHFWKRVSSEQIIFAAFLLLNLVFVLWLQTFPNVTCK